MDALKQKKVRDRCGCGIKPRDGSLLVAAIAVMLAVWALTGGVSP
jgi:hypothetical protein